MLCFLAGGYTALRVFNLICQDGRVISQTAVSLSGSQCILFLLKPISSGLITAAAAAEPLCCIFRAELIRLPCGKRLFVSLLITVLHKHHLSSTSQGYICENMSTCINPCTQTHVRVHFVRLVGLTL